MPDESNPQEPEIVGPSPAPVTTMVGSADGPTGPLVVVQFASVTGMSVYFLPGDVALQFASNIRSAAQTGPKLVTAPPGFVVPR
jgi:hypothetical protein